MTTAPDAFAACAVMLAGVPVITGGVSWTVTVKVECWTLPCASVAVHVTVVVPTTKLEPDAGRQLTGTTVLVTAAVAVGVV